MIQPSRCTGHAKMLIQKKLVEVQKTHNIRIIIALESGSRAWGFPSTDSDYDVRFIFARRVEDYLSMKEPRDVIETKITYDESLGALEDMNGWDIRKTLNLALKSNPVLFEWFQSPIRYMSDENTLDDIIAFAQSCVHLETIKNHYYKLAMNASKQIEEDPHEVGVKLYCYALRPALMLQWLQVFETIPPMDLHSLTTKLIKDEVLEKAIDDLVAVKAKAQEGQKIPRNEYIDSFIRSTLSNNPNNYTPQVVRDEQLHEGDKLFGKLILRD